MSFFIFLLAFLQGHHAVLCISTQRPVFIIKGKVEQVDQYCKGARPTNETLGTSYQPKPYPNKTFYIKKGDSNFTCRSEIIKTFSTDINGDFTFELPRGHYAIMMEE